MVGYSSLFVFVLGLVTKNIEQLCEERNRSSHFLPFFRDQKPETTVMKLRIIVVEDEKPQAEATRHILRTIGREELREAGIEGVEITLANCVADARHHLQRAVEDKKPFDIALLDLGLPENNGESESADQGLSVLSFIRER